MRDIAEKAEVTREHQTWLETLASGPGPTIARLAYETVEGAKMTVGAIWGAGKTLVGEAYHRLTSDEYTLLPWKAAWWPF